LITSNAVFDHVKGKLLRVSTDGEGDEGWGEEVNGDVLQVSSK
jgi:hypothetical protein